MRAEKFRIIIAPAVFSRSVRLATGLPTAGGQTAESSGSGKRTKFSGELGIGYTAYTTKGIGGGTDMRIGHNTSLHLGLKFTPVPTWVQEKGSHPEPDDMEKIWLNAFTFTLGIKYFLD